MAKVRELLDVLNVITIDVHQRWLFSEFFRWVVEHLGLGFLPGNVQTIPLAGGVEDMKESFYLIDIPCK